MELIELETEKMFQAIDKIIDIYIDEIDDSLIQPDTFFEKRVAQDIQSLRNIYNDLFIDIENAYNKSRSLGNRLKLTNRNLS